MALRQMIQTNLFWRGFYYFSYFLLNIGIARTFEAEGSGRIFLIINNLQIVFMLGSIGLQNGILYFSSSRPDSRPLISRISIVWSILASLFVLPLMLWLYPYDHGIDRESFIWYFVLPYMAGIMLSTFCSSMLISEGDYIMPSLIPLLINLVLLILLPFSGNPLGIDDVLWYEKVFFFTFFIQGLAMSAVYRLRNRKQPGFVYDNKLLKKIFRYSLVSLVANLAFFLLNKIDYLFVAANDSPAALGNYIQVSRIGQFFILIPTTFAAVILPEAARGKMVQPSIRLLGKAMLLLLAGIFLLILFWGDSLFVWLLGGSFTNMRLPFLLLIPGLYFLSIHSLISAYFGGKGILRVNIVSSISALMIMIIGDIIFIPLYGINAAAAISTISYLICMVISYRYYRKEDTSGFVKFFLPGRSDFRKMSSTLNHFGLNKKDQSHNV